MPNPLLQQNNNNQIADMHKLIKDPQSLIKSNPQLQQILSMYNGDAKTAFYSLCKQKGVDPNSILNQLK